MTAAPRASSDSTQALPMPEAAPVTSATSPWKGGGLAGLAQLGLLQLPVFHVEDVPRRQRLPAAQALGPLDDVHGMAVDVGDDPPSPWRSCPRVTMPRSGSRMTRGAGSSICTGVRAWGACSSK